MKLERFEEKHYNELKQWWIEHNHPTIQFSSLSPYGVVSYIEDVPGCMSFLYIYHGCDMAQIAWTTTNPSLSPRKRHKAVNDTIKSLYEVAKLNNIKNIICFSNSTGLTKLLHKHGLKIGNSHDLLAGYFGDE